MIHVKVIYALLSVAACHGCITLLDNKWRPHTIEDRASVADVVISTKTLSTFPISRNRMLYGATFEVLSILKGWSKLEELLEKGSPSVQERDKLRVTALGFGDRRHCWSSVDVGETYILFLSFNNKTGYLVAKYLGAFGAAELLYARSEDAILLSLGWRAWSAWSPCSQSCGGGIRKRQRKCISLQLCHGPREETRRCNMYTCNGATDLLKGIERENLNTKQSKLFRNGFMSGSDQMPAPSAMTYLLFPHDFPSEFSIVVTFKAALYLPRYVFSLYDANNRMLMGLKIGPGVITFYFGKQNEVTRDRSSHSFAADFGKNEWRQIGVSITASRLTITENCVQIGQAQLQTGQEPFDIFGAIYLGADISEGASKNFLGLISELVIVEDPMAIFKHCGRLIFFPSQRRQASPSYALDQIQRKGMESSGSSPTEAGHDHGGDDEEGSGNVECTANCLNGGECVNTTKCICLPGWSGKDCGQSVCNPPCENGGVCLSPGVCKCSSKFEGPFCQKGNVRDT